MSNTEPIPNKLARAEDAKTQLTVIHRYNKKRRLAFGNPLQAQVHVSYIDEEPETLIERIEDVATNEGELIELGPRKWAWRLALATTIIEPYSPPQRQQITQIIEVIEGRIEQAKHYKAKADLRGEHEQILAWQNYLAGLQYARDDIKQVQQEDS